MKSRDVLVVVLLAVSITFMLTCQPSAQPPPQVQEASESLEQPLSSDPLIAGFQQVALASVSDAVDQVAGKGGYMSHDMRPWIGKAFVGRAVTALVRPGDPKDTGATSAVQHSVEMIDEAKPGEVGVIVMEDGLEIAAIGGLMATAAVSRGMAGMVLDGAIRDIEEVRRLGLPVFARAASPATAVGRFASVSKNEPVTCAGVTVNPGDIIVAGEDGIVVVPSANAKAILEVAQEIDERESKMVPYILEEKSLQKAIEVFDRI